MKRQKHSFKQKKTFKISPNNTFNIIIRSIIYAFLSK
jgi:hypothetical protein